MVATVYEIFYPQNSLSAYCNNPRILIQTLDKPSFVRIFLPLLPGIRSSFHPWWANRNDFFNPGSWKSSALIKSVRRILQGLSRAGNFCLGASLSKSQEIKHPMLSATSTEIVWLKLPTRKKNPVIFLYVIDEMARYWNGSVICLLIWPHNVFHTMAI